MANALLFDLDGTLTDPRQGIERSIRHGMEAVGCPLEAGVDLRWCIGPPLLGSLETLLGPERKALAPAALVAYRERYGARGLLDNKLYPGIGEALAVLAGRYDLYVATSKPWVYARAILDNFGLSVHFKGLYGSELDGTRSDKGQLIAWVLAKEGLDPATTRMIGDRSHDMVGAAKNGMKGIGVLWGYGDADELRGGGAAALFERPSDLEKL
jgi:phosphoglycolate phosphatase